MGEKVGYARVSSRGQSLEVQIEKLLAAGVPDDKSNLYTENLSGRTAARPALERMLGYVRRGDILYVTRLDRLARSLSDLIKLVEKLEEKQVALVVLDQAIDTSTPSGKLMLQMLGAISEFELSLITERASEGRARALAQGVRFGVKPKLSKAKLADLRDEFNRPGSNKSELAKRYGVARSTLYRLATGPDPKNLEAAPDNP